MNCGHCHARTDSTHLCRSCTTTLDNALGQLPWLLDELDNRIARLDTISHGTIGHKRGTGAGLIIDFDAAELARKIRTRLLRWAETVAQRHTGRRIPALATVDTKTLAKWLQVNTAAIARLEVAGRLYNDITALVGTDQHPGQLHTAINPVEQHLVGPCPTNTGRNHDGTPRHCDRILYADTYDRTVTCPICGQTIAVEQTRLATAKERDLHTRAELLDLLAAIDEPVPETQLAGWIKAGALRAVGYIHASQIVEYRVSDTDEPVYSIEKSRKLRRRDNRLTHRKTPA